jgi:hypothetical protein
MALVTCSACTRHVRETESACPFCGATVTLRAATPVSTNPSGLSRAALVFGGLAVAASVAACTPSEPGPAPLTPPPPDTSPVAMYGAPPPVDTPDASIPRAVDPPKPAPSTTSAPTLPTGDPSAVVAMYGAPPMPEAPPKPAPKAPPKKK